MALTHVLLFLHLLGAVSFFGGAAVAGTIQLAAIRRERPSEVHALLRLAPVGVALAGLGALLTLGFGIALAEHEGFGFSPAWIQAALGLWVAAMALGAYGGRTARHARLLAERLAVEGDAPSAELRALVAARGPLWASCASGLLLLAILALMVWRPGGSDVSRSSARVPPSVLREIAKKPLLAYLPTRLPSGYRYAKYVPGPTGFTVYFSKPDEVADQLGYDVGVGDCSADGPAMHSFRLNGVSVFWSATYADQQAWRCLPSDGATVVISASRSIAGDDSFDTPKRRQDALDLVELVAYCRPIG